MSHTYPGALQSKCWNFEKGNKRDSHISRRRSTTSDDPKRSFGSCSQQDSVIFHKGSERPNASAPRGREGRSPFIVLKETRVETMLWNGTFPVNTYRGRVTRVVSIERPHRDVHEEWCVPQPRPFQMRTYPLVCLPTPSRTGPLAQTIAPSDLCRT